MVQWHAAEPEPHAFQPTPNIVPCLQSRLVTAEAIALFLQPRRGVSVARRDALGSCEPGPMRAGETVERRVDAIIDTSCTPHSFSRVEEVCPVSQHGSSLSLFYYQPSRKVSRWNGSDSFGNRPYIEVGLLRATRGGPSSVAKPNRRLPGGALRRYKRSEPLGVGDDRVPVALPSRRSR